MHQASIRLHRGYSHESHVLHLSPSLVVGVRSCVVLPVVSGFNVDFGIIGMVSVELEFTLHGRHMLSVNLEGESPEHTFPNHTSIGVLHSNVVFVVYCHGTDSKVSVGDIEPETDHDKTRAHSEYLEPTFRVD